PVREREQVPVRERVGEGLQLQVVLSTDGDAHPAQTDAGAGGDGGDGPPASAATNAGGHGASCPTWSAARARAARPAAGPRGAAARRAALASRCASSRYLPTRRPKAAPPERPAASVRAGSCSFTLPYGICYWWAEPEGDE